MKNIEFNKKYNTYKTLEITCPQDNPWTYNLRLKLQNVKKTDKQKKTKIYRSEFNKNK